MTAEGPSTQRARRPLVVKKFGGTSVGSVERMKSVARRCLAGQRAGEDVVAVVSAMSGETDRLLALAREVLREPDARELDVIAATGEQVSCALVAMAIQAAGGKACSVLGHQLRLLTDNAFTRARILRVELGRIRGALSRGEIPVVAGFQGVDASRNITTLGRGGSDTTAVALAAALEADACEIFTDVDGVYTSDPRAVPAARRLGAVPYEEMLELSSLGAKVLQVRSVEIAMKFRVPVHVRSSFTEEPGTWITDRRRALESRALVGLACARGQARVEVSGVPFHAETAAELTAALADHGVVADMIAHEGAAEGDPGHIGFTVAEADLGRARASVERLAGAAGAGAVHVATGLAKVSLVGIGVRSDPTIPAHACRALARHWIEVAGLATSELRVSCLVPDAAADAALRALHEAFGLSQEGPASAPP